MHFSKPQKGFSITLWLLIISVVVFFATVAFKLVPHYMDYGTINNRILEVERTPPGDIRSERDFYSHISKGMQVNGIFGLTPKKILKVRREGDTFLVQLDYERREHVIKNIDLVVHFKQDYSIRVP